LAPAKPISQTDLQSILEKLAANRTEKLDWKVSIVDLMKLLKLETVVSANAQNRRKSWVMPGRSTAQRK